MFLFSNSRLKTHFLEYTAAFTEICRESDTDIIFHVYIHVYIMGLMLLRTDLDMLSLAKPSPL